MLALTGLWIGTSGLLQAASPNILFILTDDHRYDAMSMAGHPYLETPNIDRMAAGGVYFRNACVTTSLCSPSRASILTGLYAHNHGVVDNYNPVRPDLVYFPQHLQKAGYETAFIGKWHMGDEDEPQRGFDHWVAFKGQGTYWPDGHGTTRVVPQTSLTGFNVNGKKVPQKGYITDELTDYTLDWLKQRRSEKPFFVYLSHKAVHSDFVAADRHLGKYKGKEFPLPSTYPDTPENYRNKPRWLKDQRNSRHGVDYAYNLKNFDLQAYHQRYCETLLSVDESVGRILDHLKASGQLDNTVVVYMGDNGFQFGEHGLIDKRTAYEASIKVPLIFHCPSLFPKGKTLDSVVANIDIAPTLLGVAGLPTPEAMDGRSFLGLVKGEAMEWPNDLLYEYYWEWNYPQTPTMHALRTDRYKYVRYHGIWDVNELYDLKEDPQETRNLIFSKAHQPVIEKLNRRLFEKLQASGGQNMPLMPDRGQSFPWRLKEKAKPGSFPARYLGEPDPIR